MTRVKIALFLFLTKLLLWLIVSYDCCEFVVPD
jgi:hypothetical protein